MKKWHLEKLSKDFPSVAELLGEKDIPVFLKILDVLKDSEKKNPNFEFWAIWGDLLITSSFASQNIQDVHPGKNNYPTSFHIARKEKKSYDEFAPVFGLPIVTAPANTPMVTNPGIYTLSSRLGKKLVNNKYEISQPKEATEN